MSKKTKDPLQEATDSFLTQKYATDMGQKVLVERHKMTGEHMEELREVLRDVAKDIQSNDPSIKEIDYLGSFSVHVYYSTVMKRMVFATLTAPDKVPFNVAEDASREMWGSICEDYGHKRQIRRSGTS